MRSDNLLAWAFGQVRAGNVRLEAFLEEALAAALEEPGYWPALARHLGWAEALPLTTPTVSTQDLVEQGRTDIRLTWPERSLVLELKPGEPPHPSQLAKYFATRCDVASIAAHPASLAVTAPEGSRFLGVKTWHQVLTTPLADKPLAVRQLNALLEATEVALPPVHLDALQGMVRSWEAWEQVDRWARKGMERVAAMAMHPGRKVVHRLVPRLE